MNRRDFVGATAAALIGGPPLLGAGRDQLGSIGLQLSTVRDVFAHDPDGTLATVATVGYRDVELYELYGPRGWSAPRLRAALDRNGLVAWAVHVPTPLLYRGLERHADLAASLGCTYLVCSHLDPDERRTLGDWHELAAVFNRAGETARRSAGGLRVAYHGQDYDLAPVSAHVPYDILLAETDPSLVWFEMDARMGDPVAYLTAHRGRFFALHLGAQTDTRLLAAARSAGVERYFVEIDNPGSSSMDSARRAYASLRQLRW
jgi:sugar phosphate isomerase/epimerase